MRLQAFQQCSINTVLMLPESIKLCGSISSQLMSHSANITDYNDETIRHYVINISDFILSQIQFKTFNLEVQELSNAQRFEVAVLNGMSQEVGVMFRYFCKALNLFIDRVNLTNLAIFSTGYLKRISLHASIPTVISDWSCNASGEGSKLIETVATPIGDCKVLDISPDTLDSAVTFCMSDKNLILKSLETISMKETKSRFRLNYREIYKCLVTAAPQAELIKRQFTQFVFATTFGVYLLGDVQRWLTQLNSK